MQRVVGHSPRLVCLYTISKPHTNTYPNGSISIIVNGKLEPTEIPKKYKLMQNIRLWNFVAEVSVSIL